MGTEPEVINPNEDLTADEEVSGETAGSWDDLDHEVGEESAPKPKAKAEPKKKDETEDYEDDEDETLENDDDDYEESEKEDDGEKPKPITKIRGKGISMTNSKGEEMKVSSSDTFPVKMDGEIQQVSIKDLTADYSGQKVYNEKFSELGKDRGEFTERLNTLNDYVQDIFDSAAKMGESEDKTEVAYEIIRKISGLTGGDSIALTKQLSDAFIQEGIGLSGMDERDREIWDLKRERELGKLNSAVTQKMADSADRNRQSRTQNAELMDNYSISDERAKELETELGQHSSDEITPELVVRFDRLSMAMDVISELSPDSSNDVGLRNQLTTFAIDDPTITREDLAYILKQTLGNPEEDNDKSNDNLSKKIRDNSRSSRKPKRKTESKPERAFSRSEDLWGDL